jgi:hypothetical protein
VNAGYYVTNSVEGNASSRVVEALPTQKLYGEEFILYVRLFDSMKSFFLKDDISTGERLK